jgi:hypothetical protein
LNLLLLLNLLLFNPLALLVLLLAKLIELLLMFLIELRVDVAWVIRPLRRRAVKRATRISRVGGSVRGFSGSISGVDRWRHRPGGRIGRRYRVDRRGAIVVLCVALIVLQVARGPIGLDVSRRARLGGRRDLEVRTNWLRIVGLYPAHLDTAGGLPPLD